MGRPTRWTRDRPTESARPHAMQAASRRAFGAVAIGVLASVMAGAVGIAAYRSSATEIRSALFENHLNLARLLGRLPSGGEGVTGRLDRIRRAFDATASGFAGRYLCVIGSDARLRMNTRRPEEVGTFVGDVLLAGRGGPPDVAALVHGKADWVGIVENHAGARQLAAYAYSPAADAHVAVHVPADDVDRHVRTAALPWGIALAFVSVVLIPGSLLLFGRAYVHTRAAERILRSTLDDRETRLRAVHGAAAMGVLTEGIAHDFNNVLSVIAGHVHLARTSDDTMVHLDRITEAAARGRDLVGELRGDEPTGKTRAIFRVGPLVDDMLRMLRPSVPLAIQMHRRLAADGDWVCASGAELRRVVLNLCLNASEALAGRGGTIVVTVDRVEEAADRPMDVGRMRAGSYVRLVVADDGPGVAPEIRGRMFEPYVRAGASVGMGLGLAIVARVVRGLGGAIEVESTSEVGTIVRVYVPRAVSGGPRATNKAGGGQDG